MTDDSALAGLDPYDAWDRESERLAAHLATVPDDDPSWSRESRCAGWTVRDVLAHLVADQDYFAANLAGTVADFIGSIASRGAHDLTGFNDLQLHDLDGVSPSELGERWRTGDAANRRGFRERDGGDVDTSVGAYPARWQAFHLASELATHADDMHVPEPDLDARTAWRAPFSRFSLCESKPELRAEAAGPGRTRVTGPGVDLELDDATFVAAVAGRLGDGADPALAAISTAV